MSHNRRPIFALPPGINLSEIEWEPVSPPGKSRNALEAWRHHQWKRLARVQREIAELDRRWLEAERERLRVICLEIQRGLEADRRAEAIEREGLAFASGTDQYRAALVKAEGRKQHKEIKRLRKQIAKDAKIIVRGKLARLGKSS